jgi:hypothetical protein
MTDDGEHLFRCLLDSYVSYLDKGLLKPLPIVKLIMLCAIYIVEP